MKGDITGLSSNERQMNWKKAKNPEFYILEYHCRALYSVENSVKNVENRAVWWKTPQEIHLFSTKSLPILQNV